MLEQLARLQFVRYLMEQPNCIFRQQQSSRMARANSDGHVRAPDIPMRKQGSELVQLSSGPENDAGETPSEHRRLKTSLWKHFWGRRLLVLLSSPLIYVCVLPFLVLDLVVAVYQAVCFPIYGIPKVRRSDYLAFDRGRLGYLNAIEKVGCVYCSYANGLLSYVTEITARTERYFCPIRHQHAVLHPHSRYGHFLPYGNARAYRAESVEVSRAYGDLPAQER